jgi:hypothetical protein
MAEHNTGRTRKAIWTLFLLAPATGELLSGSAPPLEFFFPPTLILLSMLYGSGALLIREAVVRWGKGWGSVFLLGLAYGIYEEGLVVRSFFDPAWHDLGVLAHYGRWIGVNWVWTFSLTLYHATISIMVPLLLVGLLYPDLRDRPWLDRRGRRVHGALFLLVLAMGPLMGMHAPLLAYAGCVIAIALLVWLARRWPPTPPAPAAPEHTPASPRRMGWLMFGAMVAGFLVPTWILPENGVPVGLPLALQVGVPLLVWWRLRRLGIAHATDRHRWAIVCGLLALFVALSLINELDGALGMSLVGIAYTVFLWRLGRREQPEDIPAPDTPAELQAAEVQS